MALGTANRLTFSVREKQVLAPFVEQVLADLKTILAEARDREAVGKFTTAVQNELEPLVQDLDKTGERVVLIPDRAIYWLLDKIDRQISILNSIMPLTGLLDLERAQFKGTGNSTQWELLQMHFKLSGYVIKRMNALEGFPRRN